MPRLVKRILTQGSTWADPVPGPGRRFAIRPLSSAGFKRSAHGAVVTRLSRPTIAVHFQTRSRRGSDRPDTLNVGAHRL